MKNTEACSCDEALALRAELDRAAGLLGGVLAGQLEDRTEARAWLFERARARAGTVAESVGPAEDEAFAHLLADPAEVPADQAARCCTFHGTGGDMGLSCGGDKAWDDPTNEDPELVCTEAGPCKFHEDQPELAAAEKCPGYCPVGGVEGCRDGVGCEEAGMCHAHAAQWHAEQAGLRGGHGGAGDHGGRPASLRSGAGLSG